MNKWQTLLLSAVIQFIITTGSAFIVAASDNVVTGIELSLSVIGGLIAAAKDVQAHLAEPPK